MLRKRVDIKKFNKVYLVHNHSAGKQSFFAGLQNNVMHLVDECTELYGPTRFEYSRIHTFREAQEVARKICAEKADWVIVAGGDGTLRAIAEVMIEENYMPYISVYPSGTVNLVAKELAQKTDVDQWMFHVSKGVTVPVWLGKANDRIFLTVAGIGVDSMVVDNVTPEEKKYLSTLAYVRQSGKVAGNEMLLHSWKYKFKVMIDNDGIWREASSVIVTKSRYYAGRFSLVNGGSLSNPALYVCLFKKNRCVDFLRYTALIAADMLSLDKTVEICKAKEVQIRCNVKNFAAELDGDSVVTSPLSISLLPTPLNFIS
ncbi:MAG: NAD(+)/NADH kinase [Acidaminococcus sp.]|jgi:diacylglycerol kinase family enzyme|nr:NAD(+)/NADH kinase [Acidaminococcus sp.]MCI2100858.1 NAD(+)/NADH kinase [Acidaminococcus sp.]MCI2115221.1 NAD(+)/NADH kinase [Acidaminococcus sp.]MCI2116646.1 NAD(+)/NADH kinase [Acidaminococcus sp.]